MPRNPFHEEYGKCARCGHIIYWHLTEDGSCNHGECICPAFIHNAEVPRGTFTRDHRVPQKESQNEG